MNFGTRRGYNHGPSLRMSQDALGFVRKRVKAPPSHAGTVVTRQPSRRLLSSALARLSFCLRLTSITRPLLSLSTPHLQTFAERILTPLVEGAAFALSLLTRSLRHGGFPEASHVRRLL